MYVGAAVATAALLAGFGAAILVYGPLGIPARQLAGSTLNVPPKGVVFGDAQVTFASQLDLINATAGNPTWNWTNASGGENGPCNASGILNQTGGFGGAPNASTGTAYTGTPNNATTSENLSSLGNSTMLVCLNSVNNGTVNATWYYNASGGKLTNNTYNSTNWIPNGSYYNASGQNVTSCNNASAWNVTHIENATFRPCTTYYEMNNNTTYLVSSGGMGNATGGYNNSTLWSPNQTGYAPSDLVYQIPVIFTNGSINGTYAISIAVGGVTPVAQTFFFNDTIGGTGVGNDTVLFTFDMTIAWLMDVTLNVTGGINGTANVTAPVIYGAIGVASAIVTECGATAAGVAVCPISDPED
ncbi:MAG TPA: hypothetical protein VMH49_02890 [Thermoplasmata archaeon]|nr:hypothetical protein [Thermoplasmata archaeon]